MYLFINKRLRTPWFLSLMFASAIPAAPLTTTPDDLFLGFRSTADPGLAVDYLIKLGPAAIFRDATASFTVAGLGDWGLDLINYFGSDWHNRAEVLWSVSGATGVSSVGTDPGRTLYVTTPRAAPGLRTVSRLRGTAAAQALPSNKIGSLGAGYTKSNNLARQSSSNSPVGTLQVLTDVNSYGSFVNEVGSYAYFTPIIEGNFANGAIAAALDLYRITPATGASIGSPAELLGTFNINTGGGGSVYKISVLATPCQQPHALR